MQAKKKSYTHTPLHTQISGLISGKELSVRSRLIAFLPQETLFWFTYGNYGLAVLAKSIHEVGFTVTVL